MDVELLFSLWQLCLGGDHAWRCHSCLDGDPGNAGYVRAPAVIVTEDIALLRAFSTCDSSAPVRTGSEKVVQLLGSWGPWRHQVRSDINWLSHRNYGPIRAFSSSLAASNQKASLAGPSLLLCPFRPLEVSWLEVLLLLIMSGT